MSCRSRRVDGKKAGEQCQGESYTLSLRPLVYHLRDRPLGLSGSAGTAHVLANVRVYSLFDGVFA